MGVTFLQLRRTTGVRIPGKLPGYARAHLISLNLARDSRA